MGEKIVVLSDKDKARKRINVFHGSSSNWINMIKELEGNSLDVFDRDVKNYITVKIHDKNKIEYLDSGKGIPVEGIASDGRKNYEAIFETPFAGSKYDNELETVGQNGIFLWSLTATCENIEYDICRPDGNIYNIQYHKGDLKNNLSILGNGDKTYSKLIFELDEEVWDTPNFTFENICEISRGQAALGNVYIKVVDIKNNKEEEVFYYEKGIESYFFDMTKTKSMVMDSIRIKKVNNPYIERIKKNDKVTVDLILSYSNDSEEDFQKDFLNTADLIQHGMIQTGIILGLKKSIDKYLKSKGKYEKKEKPINNEDVLTGLNYICNVKSLFVEYENQIKVKTSALHYKVALQEIIESFMEIFFIENQVETDQICNQVLLNKRVREKSEINRKNIKQKLDEKTSIINKVPNLIECKSKDKTKNILCICEGQSALGSLLSGRRDVHALFPLRGKVLNCFKAPLDKIFTNEVILGLQRAMNCGVEIKSKYNKDLNNFNKENLRYSKIYIMVDQDFDGIGSIMPLLLSMFQVLNPTLVREGCIYICETPKYEVTCDKEEYFAINDEELEVLLTKIKNKKYKINYIKGLAELSAQAMALCLSEDYKNITQITLNDEDKSLDTLDLFMGKDIGRRQKYILEKF